MKTGSTISDKRFTGAILEELRAGRRVVLCTVFGNRGSMPRHAGARMALLESGEFIGTVGGGRIEFLSQGRCSELLQTARSGSCAPGELHEMRWFTHADTGMMCGGDALMAFAVLDEDARGLLEQIVACGPGEGVLIEDWSQEAGPVWQVDREDTTTEVPSWDEERKLYIEPLNREPAALIYGAGHVGQALSPVLASLGFRVIVLDERENLATPENFPNADHIKLCRFDALGDGELPRVCDYVFIMTPSHAADYNVLEQTLRSRPIYLGCIGSKGKTAKFHASLAEAGFSAADIEGIHMPIGDPIGAVTPAEIAISIASEVVRFRSEICAG